MKFGQVLLESMPQDWKFYFLDYQGLKQFIKLNTQVNGPWNNTHETTFLGMLEDELKKVTSFEMVKRTELQQHVKFLENETNASKGNVSQTEQAQEIKAEMDAVTKDLTKLAKFNSLNYQAFLKIIKKHDKYTAFRLKNTFMKQLTGAAFFKETYDDLVVNLSALYEKYMPRDDWTEAQLPVGGKAKQEKLTFWVHPDNLTEVQCVILKHLPVYRTSAHAEGKDNYTTEEETEISSVYMDTDKLDLYNERLAGGVPGQSIRLRWFGASRKQILVERQKHSVEAVYDGTDRERFTIPEKYLGAYIKGEFSMASRAEKMKTKQNMPQDKIDAIVQLAQSIQETITSRKLAPVLRSFARRTVFKVEGRDTVTCKLDNDVAMIREAGRTDGSWMRANVGNYPFATLPEHEVALFPYAELEIVYPGTVPSWVTKLANSRLVFKVPAFSKYMHGCATVLEDRVETMPYWMSTFSKDIRQPRKAGDTSLVDDHAESSTSRSVSNMSGADPDADDADTVYNEERRVSLSYDIPKTIGVPRKEGLAIPSTTTDVDYHFENEEMGALRDRKLKNVKLLGSLLKRFPTVPSAPSRWTSGGPPRVIRKPIAIPVRVEPKVYFANERTFLHWTKLSVVISTLGLALIHAPPSSGHAARAAGYIMVPVAMITCVYALYTFFWRDYKINHRDPGPYSAPFGPVLVAGTFALSCTVNYLMWLAEHKGHLY